MSESDFENELHRALDWRLDEVRKLKNLIESQSESERDNLRKPLVVLLYSHFEGYCVFALQHYVLAINSLGLVCEDVPPALIAGAWEPLFRELEYGTTKHPFFKKLLPEDTKLHRHARRRELVEELERFYKLPFTLDEDRVIDVESNLKPEVLARNLYLLGLSPDKAMLYRDTINSLLRRNPSGL